MLMLGCWDGKCMVGGYKFVREATTNYHRPRLEQQKSSSHTSGVWKAKVKVGMGLVSPESSFLVCCKWKGKSSCGVFRITPPWPQKLYFERQIKLKSFFYSQVLEEEGMEGGSTCRAERGRERARTHRKFLYWW